MTPRSPTLLSSRPAPPDADRATPRLLVASRHDVARHLVEDTVRHAYRLAYGADIHHFADLMLALTTPGAGIDAAIGVTGADASPLFLEPYLDLPVEQALGRALGRPVTRRGIVEVGNLSSAQRGAAPEMMACATCWLHDRGARWAVLTGTRSVRRMLVRMGAVLHDLGAAQVSRLGPAAGAGWGTYYEHQPRVVALDLAAFSATLRVARPVADSRPLRRSA